MLRLVRTLIALTMLAAGFTVAAVLLFAHYAGEEIEPLPPSTAGSGLGATAERLDRAWRSEWRDAGIVPAPEADDYTIVRRLSLALTGAVPSVESLRRLDLLPADADRVNAWLDHLFADQRHADYLAERLARVYVGVEAGPFLVYRRRRMVNWLSEQLMENRPYGELVNDLITAEGIWTSNPAANFITVSVTQDETGESNGPDEIKLAARTSRAFLGISLDCMQCHDDKFGDHWKQRDFHELAAFFSQADLKLTGVRENDSFVYETRLHGESDPAPVPALAPYRPDLMPESGSLRTRLAAWITHRENEAFSRAMANRTWALLFGRPLVDPVDDIPLEGPYPAGLDILARDFAENGHDLRRLIRLIATSPAFHRSSSTGDPGNPVTEDMENAWAAFPLTRLRPEQVAGSIVQASILHRLDAESHIVRKLQRFGETNDFVTRFGDRGEDELSSEAGTIPQRLLLLNGELVEERTSPNPLMNSSTRLANLAPSDERAVETAFLAALTRLPTEAERDHFVDRLADTPRPGRPAIMADLYWALFNSTEFSWNR